MDSLQITIWLTTVAAIACGILMIFISIRDLKRVSLVKGNFAREFDERVGGKPITPCSDISHNDILTRIDEMAERISEQKPKFLAGVHTGGRLLSVLISEKLNIKPENVLYFSTDASRSTEIELERPHGLNFLGGSLAVIDDISRKGNTLASIKDLIVREAGAREEWFNTADFYTLIVNTGRKSRFRRGYFIPDWYGYACKSFTQGLPWSCLSNEVKLAYSNRAISLNHEKYFIDIHERLIKDYQFASRCAFLAIQEPEKFNEIVQNRQLEEI